MIILKSVTSIDSFYLENSMLEKIKVKSHAKLVVRLILPQNLNRSNWKSLLILKITLMMSSGHLSISSSMLLIMWKLDNMLITNVYGMKSHYSKAELLEQNATLKLLSPITLRVITISLTLLNKPFLYAH